MGSVLGVALGAWAGLDCFGCRWARTPFGNAVTVAPAQGRVNRSSPVDQGWE